MPKNKRSKRRKRAWNKIDSSGAEGVTIKKTDELLKDVPASNKTNHQLFYIDKKKQNQPLAPAERKAKARVKVLFIEKRINPYPQIKPKVMNVKRKRTIPIDKRIAKKRKLAEKKEP